VPIYEFSCPTCGARFERLLPAGTDSVACPQCGAERTVRVLSAQAPTQRLVQSPGAARKQEQANSRRRQQAKARLAARREAARTRRDGSG
jgi:putative FmdB family regulatory protein